MGETVSRASTDLVGKRLLILCTTTGYQTQAFVEAAQKLNLAVVIGSDRCHVLEDPWRDHALPLRFEDPEAAARAVVDYARANPIHGVVSLGDRPTPAAARVSAALGLPGHPPVAADICRDKYRSRLRLRAAGLNVPAFVRFSSDADPRRILFASHGAADGYRVPFPCVLKPLALSASRGVIRANNPDEFVSAFERIRSLLRSPDVQVMRDEASRFIQVETYVEGEEVAVEALVDRGRLRILAIFDKPDPLVGPFFEETIYVTPSRGGRRTQEAIAVTLADAVRALDLRHGPVHAEFRVNLRGVWVLEVAARSIGGMCSRAVRLVSPRGGLTLEEAMIRLALGADLSDVARESVSSGVMMIPILEAGVYRGVEGLEEALATGGVEGIEITARAGQKLVPLPEGNSYLGFIFARGGSPGRVEEALREAHRKLRFTVSPTLPVMAAGRGRTL